MEMALRKLIERRNRRIVMRDSQETDIVRTTVNLQRTPGGSITIWVQAPDGVAGGIDLDALDHRTANARGFVSWAKEQLGRNKAKRGARVDLEPRNEGTFLRVKSRRHSGALNLDEIEVDARVLRWAKASLQPPARKRRLVKAWA
jgi:hypothetical protein